MERSSNEAIDLDPEAVTGRPGEPGGGLLVRTLPLILGLVTFELTTKPMVGIVVTCLKFGWAEFLTAAWILHADPERSRGLACSAFHAALGFAKTCVAGLAAVVATLGLASCLAGQGAQVSLDAQVIAALLTIAAGGALFVATTIVALAAALRSRSRIWVSPLDHRARALRTWPPGAGLGSPGRGRENAAAAILTGTCILAVFALFLGTLGFMQACGLFAGGAVRTLLLVAVGLAGSSYSIGALFRRLSHRIVALDPRDCWPES